MADASQQWMGRIGVILFVVVLAILLLRVVPFLGKVAGEAYYDGAVPGSAGIRVLPPQKVGNNFEVVIKANIPPAKDSVSFAFTLTYDPEKINLVDDCPFSANIIHTIFSNLDTRFHFGTEDDLTLTRQLTCDKTNGILTVQYTALCDETCSNQLSGDTELAKFNFQAVAVGNADISFSGDSAVLSLSNGENAVAFTSAIIPITAVSCPGSADSDGDGFCDNADNCIAAANADQRDTDRGCSSSEAAGNCGDACDDNDDNDDVFDCGSDGNCATLADNDCAPRDETIFPDATEICNDGKDNDCDGNIDIVDIGCINAELTSDENLNILLGRMLFTAKVGRKMKEVIR